MVTFHLCFNLGSWNESFLSPLGFLASFELKCSQRGCCRDSFASNLSLSGCCLPSLASVPQGMLYFVPWWTLLYLAGSLPWRSLFCLCGTFWMPGGHHSSWSTSCWAVCGWGRISSVQSVAPGGSFSVFSEMKLETSFSTVSHCVFLALTQLSKVLKWTLLVLYVISGVLKGIKFSLTFPTMSWEAIFSLPDLPMVLKEVCLPLCMTKSLSRMCTGVLKGVNFCLWCSLLPHVPLTGVLKWVSMLSFSQLTRIPFIWRVLKWVSNSMAKSSCGASVNCFLTVESVHDLKWPFLIIGCLYAMVLKWLEMNLCFHYWVFYPYQANQMCTQ